MCCSGDSTAKSTEQAQAAFTNTLSSAFTTAFGANQAMLGTLSAKLTQMINNPQGFSPATLALMKTNATETTQAQTLNAERAASAAESMHGGPTLGSGVNAQIAGSIAATGAEQTAQEESNIDVQSGLLQNANYWKAISGLTNVAEAENPTGIASSEAGVANSTANLSNAVTSSEQAGWSDVGSIISGVAGLGEAAVGAYTGLGFGGKGAGGGGNA